MSDPKKTAPIPADLMSLWKFLNETKETSISVEVEDLKAFVMRIADADAACAAEKLDHKATQSHLDQTTEIISTTCKRWLAIVERKNKK